MNACGHTPSSVISCHRVRVVCRCSVRSGDSWSFRRTSWTSRCRRTRVGAVVVYGDRIAGDDTGDGRPAAAASMDPPNAVNGAPGAPGGDAGDALTFDQLLEMLSFTDGEFVRICHKIKDGRSTAVVFSPADAWGKVAKLRAIADV
jgi:hypothetical protein